MSNTDGQSKTQTFLANGQPVGTTTTTALPTPTSPTHPSTSPTSPTAHLSPLAALPASPVSSPSPQTMNSSLAPPPRKDTENDAAFLGPPPSYEEATGIAPGSVPANGYSTSHGGPGQSTNHVATTKPKLPGRPPAQFQQTQQTQQTSQPQFQARPWPSQSGPPGGPSSSAPPGRLRRFPQVFNLYGYSVGNYYTLGEHQESPLFGVTIEPSWTTNTRPTVAIHSGPDVQSTPLLAGVNFSNMSDRMSVTLLMPSIVTLQPTVVPLDIIFGWSHAYRFSMEVGTNRGNAHMESFEWRHSSGPAISALGSAHDGWKLVRMNTPRSGGPRPAAFTTSDGCEVVAVWADALMSITKQFKFAFCRPDTMIELGERWTVMATISAIAIWEKETGNQTRRTAMR